MRAAADTFIKLGFWSQIVMLGLLDWASLAWFARHGAPWYHVAGFVAVNAVLLSLTVYAWRWLRTGRSRRAR